MVYAPGDSGDERVHARFHADALLGPRLLAASSSCSSYAASAASPSSLVEVISFPASSSDGARKQGGGESAPSLRGRVLHARPGPALAGAGVSRALAVAEAALGAAPGWLLGAFSAVPAAAAPSAANGGDAQEGRGGGGGGEPSASPPPLAAAARPARSRPPLTAAAAAGSGRHAFLFECSETRRAVGVAVVESLASGTRLRRVLGGEGGGGREGGGEGTEATTAAGATKAPESTAAETTAGAAGAALGVRGVWVAPSHRRRGLATALLDAARARAVTYTVVGRRAQVVFSQPSEAGGGEALARSYAGAEGFWSYL